MGSINQSDSIASILNNDKQMIGAWEQNTREGIIICSEKMDVKAMNPNAADLLYIDTAESLRNLSDIIPAEQIEELMRNKSLLFEQKALLHLVKTDSGFLILVEDKRGEHSLIERIQKDEQINRDLQEHFEKYGDDTIYITDGKGNTLYAGSHIAETCGISREFFKGKNVADLEKKGIFRPSVTLKVLESGKQEVVIQKTKLGTMFLSYGFPVFDADQNIVKVISITRDLSSQNAYSSLVADAFDNKENSLAGEEQNYDFITQSRKIYNLIDMVRIIAMVDSTVLISGETGVGKDVMARLIHKLSPRAGKPFVKVNCGTIAENLVESELFGYESGAFTGANKEGKVGLIETAEGGTVFLDEIGELPLTQQVKLLQVLQEKKLVRVGGTKPISIDVRFISATNKDLSAMVSEGKFREDLYYRLNVVPIEIPPLRERKEDIMLLIRHFIKLFNSRYGFSKRISKEATQALSAYNWPGNVRELEHALERLIVTTKVPIIEFDDLPSHVKDSYLNKSSTLENQDVISVSEIIPLQEAVELVERKLIEMALEKCETAQKAAELLQVNQSTISRKIQRYGLDKKS